MTDNIFGSWSTPSPHADELELLFHKLAAQHVGTPQFQPNLGLSQRKAEIISLWELYRRMKPRVVLECGVAQGASFCAWCQLGRDDALIIGVDRSTNDARPRPGENIHPSLAPGTGYPMTEFGGGMHALKKGRQTIVPINGWTTDQRVKNELASVLAGRTIDFCFHDASHDEATFRLDFQWLWPLISDGGCLAIHDTMPSAHPDVTKSIEWERIKREEDYSACFEFRGSRTDDSLGIGMLLK